MADLTLLGKAKDELKLAEYFLQELNGNLGDFSKSLDKTISRNYWSDDFRTKYNAVAEQMIQLEKDIGYWSVMVSDYEYVLLLFLIQQILYLNCIF